jgi:hypothetical protein
MQAVKQNKEQNVRCKATQGRDVRCTAKQVNSISSASPRTETKLSGAKGYKYLRAAYVSSAVGDNAQLTKSA